VKDDPIHDIPLGPPAVNTLEPTSDNEDEDGMMFTGAWYIPAILIDDKNDGYDYSPAAYLCPTVSKIVDVPSPMDDESVMPTPLIVDATEPVMLRMKHVHKKKNSQANVQEVLSESEGEGTEWIEKTN
jgi:hypothetical protein